MSKKEDEMKYLEVFRNILQVKKTLIEQCKLVMNTKMIFYKTFEKLEQESYFIN